MRLRKWEVLQMELKYQYNLCAVDSLKAVKILKNQCLHECAAVSLVDLEMKSY